MKKTINYGLLMLVMLFSMASNIFADNKYGLKDNIQDGVLLFTKEQVKDPSGMMFIVHTILR